MTVVGGLDLLVHQAARQFALFTGRDAPLEAMFAGPICGASMNPARSLAPAIVSGHLEHLWIYLTATVLGALIAVPLAKAIEP